MLVTDVHDRRLVHLQWPPRRIAEISRIGRGPGEYEALGDLVSLGVDSTLAPDSDLSRWLVLAHDRIVATVSSTDARVATFGLHLAGGDRAGHLLAVRGPPIRVSHSRPDSVVLVRGTLAVFRVDTVARLRSANIRLNRVAPSRGGALAFVANPLLVDEQALLFPDGWIALARLNPYRIDWRAADGRMIRGANLDTAAVRVDERIKRMVLARDLAPFRDAPTSILPDWPEYVPPFQRAALFAAPDGKVLIHRVALTDDNVQRYDLVDRKVDSPVASNWRRRAALSVPVRAGSSLPSPMTTAWSNSGDIHGREPAFNGECELESHAGRRSGRRLPRTSGPLE